MKKQIKHRFFSGFIWFKYYENDRGQRHGKYIGYWDNNILMTICNYTNGQLYGLEQNYYENGEIEKQIYHL